MKYPEFYVVPEDIYRIGNQDEAKLNHVRPRDIDTVSFGKELMVIANGKGISVYDRTGINESPMNGWIWRIKSNTRLPSGLVLVKDKNHHFCIAPKYNMAISKYKQLLDQLSPWAQRMVKKPGEAI